MKLVTFVKDDSVHIGAWTESGVVTLDDLGHDAAGTPSMRAFLAGGGPSLDAARERVAAPDELIAVELSELLAPVPDPRKFLAVGGNFASHIEEAQAAGLPAARPGHPIFFNKQVTSVTSPYGTVLKPRDSEEFDYEGEPGLVIGRLARNLTPENALDAVAGFVVVNDLSVRDWQLSSPTSTMGKSFDTHGPFGPWIVTPDEAPTHDAQRIRTWVNGEQRQDGTTTEMVFDTISLLVALSGFITLEPGDVLALGSPSGVGGLLLPQPKYLRIGDTVRVEVDGVGAIEHIVVDEPDDHYGR